MWSRDGCLKRRGLHHRKRTHLPLTGHAGGTCIWGGAGLRSGHSAKRLAALRRLRRKPTLLIDGITGEIFGDIAAQLRRQGRHHRYRVQDVWLASQAIQHGYGFLTRNARDFEGIPGLELVLLPS